MAKAAARHILVKDETLCQDLKTRIADGEDFATLAREHSQCPSGRDGGNLGSFGPGQMVREFDEVVFSAPIKAVQGPVKTQFGFHLLEVTERQD
ncbi:MAG: peptidylprolyl isomerase [Wenzhouxiangella sp.]|jgi:peptidyl-prolyl cis-trans isomerase C|nr:peptidylprolyl isomerase [Wenzhouxiangella sp.]